MKNRILTGVLATMLITVPGLSNAATLSAKGVDITIFGILQAELSSVDIKRTTNPDAEVAIRDNGVQSRIGFDVKKDLSGGMSAIGRLEYTQVVGDGGSPGAREQWVGLKGRWGEFNAGRNQAPMKYIGGAAYDIFVATALQARGSGGAMWAPGSGFGAAGFVNHSIKYRTPKDVPVTVHALIMPSNSQNSADGDDSGGIGNGVDFNVGVKFGNQMGEIVLGLSQDTVNDAQKLAAFNNDETVVRVGGKLNLGAITLLAQVENIRDALRSGGIDANGAFAQGNACTGGSRFSGGDALSPAGVGQCNTAMNPGGDGNVYFLGAHWKLNNWVLVLQGGMTDADATAAIGAVPAQRKREATNVTLGAVYFYDKTTRVYGGVQNVSVEEGPAAGAVQKPDRDSVALGIRFDF